MKGFYIEITNNLLEPKHIKKMGSSVWEYMWCLDKMTSVNENGIGKILGGKPIKSDEIAKQLGLSRRTVSENLNKLSKGGYINLQRTPYGYVITLNKAKKIFGRKQMAENITSVDKEMAGKVTSDGGKHHIQMAEKPTNKEDNAVRDNTVDRAATSVALEKDNLNPTFEWWKDINPNYTSFYGNKTERKAQEWLLHEWGEDGVKKSLLMLRKTNTMPYMPKITTPYELKRDHAKLRFALEQEKNKTKSKNNTKFAFHD